MLFAIAVALMQHSSCPSCALLLVSMMFGSLYIYQAWSLSLWHDDGDNMKDKTVEMHML